MPRILYLFVAMFSMSVQHTEAKSIFAYNGPSANIKRGLYEISQIPSIEPPKSLVVYNTPKREPILRCFNYNLAKQPEKKSEKKTKLQIVKICYTY